MLSDSTEIENLCSMLPNSADLSTDIEARIHKLMKKLIIQILPSLIIQTQIIFFNFILNLPE